FCLPLFPDASLAFGPLVFTLAVIGVIYGAWVSTVQPDMKKLVAYSSVSHLGFVMLGIFTLNQQGLVGGLIQMVNHGLSTGALFLMVVMIFVWIGVYPAAFTGKTETTIAALIAQVQAKTSATR